MEPVKTQFRIIYQVLIVRQWWMFVSPNICIIVKSFVDYAVSLLKKYSIQLQL